MWLGFWLVSGRRLGRAGTRRCGPTGARLVSYTSNLRRVRDALFDAETSWDKVTNVFQAGGTARQGDGSDPFRAVRWNVAVAPRASRGLDPARRRRRQRVSRCAGIAQAADISLAMVRGRPRRSLASSVCTLATRVRSLDRLR